MVYWGELEQRVLDEEGSLEQKVQRILGLAVGSGSVCWETLSGAGEFNSIFAKAIVEDSTKQILKLFKAE